MNSRTRASTIGIACCLLFATAASVNAQIIRCADSAGATSFTDAACVTDSREVQMPAAKPVSVTGKQLVQNEKFAAAEKARTITASNKITVGRNTSVDQMTVRGAKVTMDSADIVSEQARQQASAEKALQVNQWAFWRS